VAIFCRICQGLTKYPNTKIQNRSISYNFDIVFPRSVILIGQELIYFLCVVLHFLNKMYVQSMYIKCITNLILDLDGTRSSEHLRRSVAWWLVTSWFLRWRAHRF
jgi:hypothetical protein